MSETLRHSYSYKLHQIYTQLNPEDVEQFYAGYQLWSMQQQIAALQEQIDALQQQIAENTERMQQVQPAALALATLARLQASGVSNIDLLDRMLERGESWLDSTMQRLEYCERLGFIRGDYAQWCEHALEGAYDWIDSMQEASSPLASPPSSPSSESPHEPTAATEELLLQKLMSDEEEEQPSVLETTLKLAAVSPPVAEELSPTATNVEEPVTLPEEPLALEEASEPEYVEFSPTSAEESLLIETSSNLDSFHIPAEQVPPAENADSVPSVEAAADASLATDFSPVLGEEPEYAEFSPIHEEALSTEESSAADSSLVTDEEDSEPEYLEFSHEEEPLPIEASSASDSSPATGEEALESKYVEFAPTPEELLPANAGAAHDLVSSEQVIQPEQGEAATSLEKTLADDQSPEQEYVEFSPTPKEELLPADPSPELASSSVMIEQLIQPEQGEATTPLEESPAVEQTTEQEHAESASTTEEKSLATSTELPLRWEEPLPSEVNTSYQTATQGGTPERGGRSPQAAPPQQRRNFLVRLVAKLFRQ